jgi:hypothetical protein
VGGVASAGNYATGTNLTPYQAKLQDPYEYAPEASTYASPCSGSSMIIEGGQWNNRQLTPGCWSNLSIRRDIVLQSGTYVVNGGLLEFTAGANVTATGPVTFILTGSNSASIARLSVTGNATFNLSAPTSGPLKDILFYQDRRARHLSSENTLIGNATSTLNGSIYFPGSNLNFTGNSTTSGICVRIVALRITMTGNSQVTMRCPGNVRDNLAGHMARLVA